MSIHNEANDVLFSDLQEKTDLDGSEQLLDYGGGKRFTSETLKSFAGGGLKPVIDAMLVRMGVSIPEGTDISLYPTFITSTSYGLPANSVFSRASTKPFTQPDGSVVTLPVNCPDFANMKFVSHGNGLDYGFGLPGVEFQSLDDAGATYPGKKYLRLDAANGGILADSLSMDLSTHLLGQISGATINRLDETDNFVTEGVFDAELIPNSDFSGGVSDWSEYSGSNPRASSGKMRFDVNGQMGVFIDLTIVSGDYLVSLHFDSTNKSQTGDKNLFYLGNAGFLNQTIDLQDGENVFTAQTAGVSRFYMHSTSTNSPSGSVDVDDFSIRRVNDSCQYNATTKILTISEINLSAENAVQVE